ncbi:MAG: PIG-L family deacetylase [Promethearchaeota archaeon]|nr:MAG: PIG-L family deacetylase [Candidatus Lokiarchaeota archaeon]
MTHTPKKPNVLIFSPHIDDVEFGIPFFYVRVLQLGFKVTEVVMTNSEFGTHKLEFKGKRLRQIRIHELKNSVKLFHEYTQNRTNLIYLNYIDGHLPVSRKTITQISDIIREETPKIILAPDPWYSLDHHPDHIHTGILVFLALRKIKSAYFPKKIYYYYTYNSNQYFRVHWKDKNIIYKAYNCFQSQVTPLQRRYLKLIFLYLYCRRYYKSGFFTENFREQYIKHNKIEHPKKMNLLEKIKYHFYRKLTLPKVQEFHNLTPKEIGLA